MILLTEKVDSPLHHFPEPSMDPLYLVQNVDEIPSPSLLIYREHVEENLAAVGWRLDPDHEKEIEEIFAI